MPKMYLPLLILIIALPSFVFSQSEKGSSSDQPFWYLFASYGVPFWEKGNEPTYQSFETSFSILPRVHANVGVGCNYPLFKKVSISIEAAYEFGDFSRVENYNYTQSNGNFREGIIEDRFQTHSVHYPFKLNYDFKRFGFSVGAISSIHFSTNAHIKRTYYDSGEFKYSYFEHFKAGERRFNGSGIYVDSFRADLDRRFNFQALIATRYQIESRIILKLEIRRYLLENQLVTHYDQYDVVGTYSEVYHPFPNTISVGISYIFP